MQKFIQGRWASFFKKCFKVYLFLQLLFLISNFVFSHYEIEGPFRSISKILKAKDLENLEKEQQVSLEEEKIRKSIQNSLQSEERKQFEEITARNAEKALESRKFISNVFKWAVILLTFILFLFIKICCVLIPLFIYSAEAFYKYKVYREIPNKSLRDSLRFWLLGRMPEPSKNNNSNRFTA